MHGTSFTGTVVVATRRPFDGRAWHSHDPEQLAQLSVDDVLWEDPFSYPAGALRGRDALRG